MKRVYNFSAGPAVLPEEVLREAAEEMLDYNGTGMSVMEMSHRSKAFEEIIQTAEQDLRDLMHIPDNYTVLFLQGGASQQFSAIPMNLMKNGVADYIVTGQWAKKAYQEAQKYGKAVKIASSEDETFSYIPDCSDLPIDPDADYVYICENNTIYGTKFKTLPNTKGKHAVILVHHCRDCRLYKNHSDGCYRQPDIHPDREGCRYRLHSRADCAEKQYLGHGRRDSAGECGCCSSLIQ